MSTATMRRPAVKNYVGGQFTESKNKSLEVLSPIDGEVISTVPLSSANDLDAAVKTAKAAFETWSQMPVKERVQIFYRYKTLMEKNLKELAMLVQEENGKTLDEATAEVEKS